MPEMNGPDKNSPKQSRFIREKILRQPMSKRQIVKSVLAVLCFATLFGVVAAVSFVISKPLAFKYLGEESTKETIPVTIPKDEPETASQTQPSATDDLEETEPIEDQVYSVIEEYQFNAENLNNMYGALQSISQEVDKGIVTVHSVRRQKDWFDNPVENTGLYAGAVVAITPLELLILTPAAVSEDADTIRVTFSNGTEVEGVIKQTDQILKLAVVSVDTSLLGEDILKHTQVIELGNSYTVKQGDLVIAIGSPAGMVHSTAYGSIAYITRNALITDGITRLMYTDLKSNSMTGTFLMNLSGQIIGWVTDEYKNEGSEDMTVAMSISDYKSMLERLTNGIAVPYFGIQGQEVTADKAEEKGLPRGLYVVTSILDGPAYNAGIQSGDIITKMGEKEIGTMKEFQAQLEKLSNGEIITVLVQRYGREEYKELEYQVTIGSR